MAILSIWDKMRAALEKEAKYRFGRDIALVKLIISIIISGGKEKDKSYLKSNQFLYHCFLVGLKDDYVIHWFEKAWKKTIIKKRIT
jgi:hypothetical protein